MTLHDVLRRAAWRLPDQPFIYWSDRKRSVTYAQGEQLAGRIAGMLSSLEVKKGDRVGLFAHNGLDYVWPCTASGSWGDLCPSASCKRITWPTSSMIQPPGVNLYRRYASRD